MSPRRQFCLALRGALLAGWPLWRLTMPAETAAAAPEARETPENARPATLTVRFTGKPKKLRVQLGDETLAARPANEDSPWESEVTLPAGAAPLALRVQAEWDGDAPQAVTLGLEPDCLPAREATRWSDAGRLDDIFLFSW
ncbi:MAG: hypothetical protein LIO63_01925 [Akkermansia sp.]|nr:hypothetical protein [Akkermansia sp.]